MKKLLTLIALTAALSTTVACSKKNKDSALDGSNLPPVDANASMGTEGVNSDAIPGVDANAQSILAAEAGDRIFFGFDSSTVNAEGEAVLTKQAQWLQTNQSNITVEGHCDERGTREYNLALGEKRANAVKNFLVSRGVAANRISTISYGKEFPEFLGSNEEAWGKNRRAVTVVNQ